MNINLPGFKQGDPLTIINTMSRRLKDPNGKMFELLDLIYKDDRTGLKHKTEIINPDYEFFVAKEDKRERYNRLFIPKDDAKSVITTHMNLDKKAAIEVGLKDWFYDKVSSKDRRAISKIHTHPDLFMSDVNIEDYYRFWFNIDYQNEICNITKAYYDIEADTIHMAGDFPELGECPVNAITIVFENTMEVYTFLLRSANNPQIIEFEDYMRKGGTRDLHDFVLNHVLELRQQDPKIKNKSLGVENFKYNLLFYNEENELDMIADFFKLINTAQPDFAMAWNQAFDLPYLIARCKVLGADPALIMSHPDFNYKMADYFIDERVLNEFAERCDFAIIPSYTVYLDQMIQFASRRKGQTQYISFGLDYIGERIAKVGKLDYKEITSSIGELPYKNYKVFAFYNICDTIVQYCIEQETGDIDYVFGKALVNNTRYSKVHRQTVYLANRGMKEFWDEGFIIGNNVNRFNEKPTEKFPGAFVADPLQVSDYSRLKVVGKPVNLFDNCDDFD